ncbi:MAG: nickel ABC transporter permease [Planctomycetota bacterium]|jgi:peptide/nickel transport system permease protein
MARTVLRRIGAVIPLVLGMTVIIFSLLYAAPGDPAEIILRSQGIEPTPDAVDAFHEQHGLHQAPPVRYFSWLGGLCRGDLGISFRTGDPVRAEFFSRFGVTVELALSALVVSLVIALPLGVVSAVRANGVVDHAGRFGALLGVSVPSFGLGFLLMYFFAVRLKWFPVFGHGTPAHLVLPAVTLGAALAPSVMRLARASLLDVLGSDFIRTARAKGLPERKVIWKHALKPAMNPVLTQIGLQFGALLGGVAIIETVFAWPGVGKFFVDGIFARDLPVIQGFTLITVLIFIGVNLVSDLAYVWLDPRIRLAEEGD